MTTTHNAPVDTGGIPDVLKRNPDNTVPGAKPAAKLTSTAPAVTKIKAAAEKVKAAVTKPAKQAKPKTAKPAKEPKPTDDAAALPKSIVPASYKARYAETNDTCGKPLSLALKEATTHASKEQAGRVVLDVEALWAIAKANDVNVSKYVDLNNGQKRMNVYNRLVGRLNNGHDVRIGKQVFKAEKHTPTTAPKAKAKPAAKSVEQRAAA